MNAAAVQDLVAKAHQHCAGVTGVTYAILALVETLQPDEPEAPASPPRSNTSALYSRAEAEAQGFAVDTSTWPWLAYKGPRHHPSVTMAIRTPEYPSA